MYRVLWQGFAMRAATAGPRYVFTIALAVAVGAAGSGLGQADKSAGTEASKAPEKTIAFSMSGKPWKEVFQWLTDQTGLPVVATTVPTDSFSFIAPARRTYTIPEVIDIINEGLLSNKNQRTMLIRRPNNFVLVTAEDKIDPILLPRIPIDELEKHGNTEMVSTVLQLNSLIAEDLEAQVKKMLGPFGEVSSINSANQLVLQDTVGNIRRIQKTLQGAETSDKGSESYSHKCDYIKAREAERILKELLGDSEDGYARRQQWQQWQQGQPGGPQGQQNWGFASRGARCRRMPVAKIRPHYIASDERTNTVLVSGPPDKIAQAREIMKRIDVVHARPAARTDRAARR